MGPKDIRTTREILVYHIFRILLGLIFIVAAYDKILMPWEFGRAIYAYQFLPGWSISPMAIVMPWAELIAGVLLLFNKMVRPGAIVIMLLNLAFIIAIGSAIARGLDVECGCGLDKGPFALIGGTQADGWALVRDLIFSGMALLTYMYSKPGNE